MNINKILKEIADKNNVSIAQVRKDIQEAIDYSWNSNNEKAKEFWSKVPTKHEKPTLEEAILHIINSIKP